MVLLVANRSSCTVTTAVARNDQIHTPQWASCAFNGGLRCETSSTHQSQSSSSSSLRLPVDLDLVLASYDCSSLKGLSRGSFFWTAPTSTSSETRPIRSWLVEMLGIFDVHTFGIRFFTSKLAKSDNLSLDIPISVYQNCRRISFRVSFNAKICLHFAEFDFTEYWCQFTPDLGQDPRFHICAHGGCKVNQDMSLGGGFGHIVGIVGFLYMKYLAMNAGFGDRRQLG